MSNKDKLELQSWRSWWENRHEQSSKNAYELIRGAPNLLSSKTIENIDNKLIDALELQSNDVLVDVGCGIGDSICLLVPKCQKVVGIDYAKSLLDIATQRCNSKGIESMLICASITNIPLKDNSIDKLICMSVLQFISEQSWGGVMKEFRRIVKDNGIILIWCKNNFTLMTLYQRGMGC